MLDEADADVEGLVAETRELLASTIGQLEAAGVRDEALATYRAPRGISILKTSPALVPAGRAWRLGVLLIDRELQLFATGTVTRAIEPGRAAVNRSKLGEQRRADRMTASRGPFPEGEVVNFGYTPIPLTAESLRTGATRVLLRDGAIVVHWGEASNPLSERPIADYLADRVTIVMEDWNRGASA